MNKLSVLALAAVFSLGACGGAGENGAEEVVSETGEANEPVEIAATAGTYELDPNHAILQFSISHLGASDYHARFGELDGSIQFDPDNLSNSSVSFTVQADSVDTGFPGDYPALHPNSEYESWDEDLSMNPMFLGGADNPVITFQSTSVEQTGPRTGEVTGDLSFRGITSPITLDVRFIGEMEHMTERVPVIGFEAEGEILRTDFGMAEDFLGATATVYFNGEFIRQGDLQQGGDNTATPDAG